MTKFIFKVITFSISFYLLVFYVLNASLSKQVGLEVLELWLFKVILSIVPMYLFSMLLSIYPVFSKLFYKTFNLSGFFENSYALNLFLISFLTGNPTSTILIIKSLNTEKISLNQAKLLLNSCSYISPLFLLLMLGYKIGFIIMVSNFLSNLIIYIISVKNINPSSITFESSFFQTISATTEDLPLILLKILITIGIVSLIKLPFSILNGSILNYPLDLLEISTGLNNILVYKVSIMTKLILISIITSLNGFAIMLQVYTEIKKTRLAFGPYFKSRITHAILNIPISLVLFCLIEFII